LGYVPYQELPALYQRADVFVLPSLTESFGQVFAEAMACGLPVVGTTAGGIPEVVGPEQARWLVPPGDTVALTERLSEAIQSLDELRKMGLRNAAYVRQRFSWVLAAAKYATLYDSLRTGSAHSR
jgi:glycosyltransferase involved in cell wall biosynthesis